MKKIALALALLLIFSLLASCNEGDDTPEVTTTVATTTATTVATTTAKPEPTDGITVGMRNDIVLERLDDYVIEYGTGSLSCSHLYFVDSNGDNVVVTMTPNTSNSVVYTNHYSHENCDCAPIIIVYGVVESVFRCPPVEKPQLSRDELLQTKLTPEEALEKLGMPWDPQVSSYMGIRFNTSDNTSLIATFDNESGRYSFS